MCLRGFFLAYCSVDEPQFQKTFLVNPAHSCFSGWRHSHSNNMKARLENVARGSLKLIMFFCLKDKPGLFHRSWQTGLCNQANLSDPLKRCDLQLLPFQTSNGNIWQYRVFHKWKHPKMDDCYGKIPTCNGWPRSTPHVRKSHIPQMMHPSGPSVDTEAGLSGGWAQLEEWIPSKIKHGWEISGHKGPLRIWKIIVFCHE